MSIAKDLYQVQEFDLALEGNIHTQKRVSGQIGESQTVIRARARLVEEQKNLEAFSRQQKSAEWEIDDLTSKIKTIEKKLYDGKIFNSKELSNLQAEAEDLKKRRSALEDKVLDLMDQIEVTRKIITGNQEELARLEADWQLQQKQLAEELEQLKIAHTELESRRQQLVTTIEAGAHATYQELRKRKGTAVAKVEQGTCQGCHIALPNSDLQQAKGGGMVRCSSCGRIIFLA